MSEYNFKKTGNNKVYYFILNNSDASFSNMFENINKLRIFSFNNKFINNFNIIDIKGIFYGCSSLISVSFNSVKIKNVTDISYLFYNCNSLISVNLLCFDSIYIENMNSLFYN